MHHATLITCGWRTAHDSMHTRSNRGISGQFLQRDADKHSYIIRFSGDRDKSRIFIDTPAYSGVSRLQIGHLEAIAAINAVLDKEG